MQKLRQNPFVMPHRTLALANIHFQSPFISCLLTQGTERVTQNVRGTDDQTNAVPFR